MKPRRVILLVEFESDEKIKDLREHLKYALSCQLPGIRTKVLQIQSNVVSKKKK